MLRVYADEIADCYALNVDARKDGDVTDDRHRVR
jgi:hypothetical protein